jgi:hypothetical protein
MQVYALLSLSFDVSLIVVVDDVVVYVAVGDSYRASSSPFEFLREVVVVSLVFVGFVSSPSLIKDLNNRHGER